MRLFYSIRREMHNVAYYQESLERARKGLWRTGKGDWEQLPVSSWDWKYIKKYKANYKKALDAVKYDSEALAKLLFGPGYLE